MSGPPGAGCNDSRKGAGELSCAAVRRQMQPAQRFAARMVLPEQHGAATAAAPQLPLRSTCPAAHNASLLRLVQIKISCDGAARQLARQGRMAAIDAARAGVG